MTDCDKTEKSSTDEINKKQIGNQIKQYREDVLQMSREKFGEKIGCRYYTLENVERGMSYPDINFIAELSNHCNRPVYSFVMSNFVMQLTYEDRKLVNGYPNQVQIDILMRAECEKYDILHMYDKKRVADMFDENMKNETIGYLVRFEREKRRMPQKELAAKIGFEEKSVNNFEFGNSHISFRALNKICNLMQVPMDYFLAGYLTNKEVVIDYLLMDLFNKTTDKERYYIEEYIRLLKYRKEMDKLTNK